MPTPRTAVAMIALTASVAANLYLGKLYFRGAEPQEGKAEVTLKEEAASKVAQASRPQPVDLVKSSAESALDWKWLEGRTPEEFRENMKKAGFPPTVVKALLMARLDRENAPKLRREIDRLNEVPFWKRKPNDTAKYFGAVQEIRREQSATLITLLKDDFFDSGPGQDQDPRRRTYGELTTSKIDLLERINNDYRNMQAGILDAAEGVVLPSDRQALRLLADERMKDLASLLSPAELADYNLRSGPAVPHLRSALTAMNASEAEFLKIQAIYAIQLDPARAISTSADPLSPDKPSSFEIAGQLRDALGDGRYQDFVRASSGEYRRLSQLGERLQVPQEQVDAAFAVRSKVATQSDAILSNTAYSSADKVAALNGLVSQAKRDIVAAMGDAAGAEYLRMANSWLSKVASGNSVEFGPDNATRYRTISDPKYVKGPKK